MEDSSNHHPLLSHGRMLEPWDREKWHTIKYRVCRGLLYFTLCSTESKHKPWLQSLKMLPEDRLPVSKCWVGCCLGSKVGFKSFQAENQLKPQLPTSLVFAVTQDRHKSSACSERILTIRFETHQREGMKKEGIKQALRTPTICLLWT